MWRDLERLCLKHRLAWRQPSEFPRFSVPAARACLVALKGTRGPDYVREVYLSNFARDEDIASEAVLLAIANRLGMEPEAFGQDLRSEAVKQALRSNTTEAVNKGMFGAPNF